MHCAKKCDRLDRKVAGYLLQMLNAIDILMTERTDSKLSSKRFPAQMKTNVIQFQHHQDDWM